VPDTLELVVPRLPYVIVYRVERDGNVAILDIYDGRQDRG